MDIFTRLWYFKHYFERFLFNFETELAKKN